MDEPIRILIELRDAAQAAADQTHTPVQQRVFAALAEFAGSLERDIRPAPAPAPTDDEATKPGD